MDSGHIPPPPERLRPTLQLKIKANSWNGFRPTPPERLRPTLQLKIKANSWNEFRPIPPERLRPTLQLNIKANSWNKGSAENLHELTWRRPFSFQLILISLYSLPFGLLPWVCWIEVATCFSSQKCKSCLSFMFKCFLVSWKFNDNNYHIWKWDNKFSLVFCSFKHSWIF